MALPINIEDLLNKRKVEGNRIEFKKSSPRATFETTEDRLTFLIHIPVYAGCDNKPVSGVVVEDNPVTTETTTEKATETTTERGGKTTEKTTEKILRLMRENPQITNKELADACGITEDGVYWNTKKLRKNNTSGVLAVSLVDIGRL